jgi:hypothetical protein
MLAVWAASQAERGTRLVVTDVTGPALAMRILVTIGRATNSHRRTLNPRNRVNAMTPANAQGSVAGAYRTLSDDELEIIVGGAATLQGSGVIQPPSKAPPPIEPAAARQ